MIHGSSENVDGVWFTVAVNEKGQLVACAFSDSSRQESERAVKGMVRVDFLTEHDSYVNRRLQQLYALFLGRGKVELKELDLSLVSEFSRRVYNQTIRIPRGKVTTYGAIAKKLRSKGYSRAVGTALATNPLPLAIPCHRVVTSTLRVVNYGMPGRKPSEGAYMKKMLLDREGVRFQGNRVAKDCVWNPEGEMIGS